MTGIRAGGRGGVVRLLLTRLAVAVAVTGLAACGLDAQPRPQPIPSDRLPDSLVVTPGEDAAAPSPSG
jgi:hypothetical protein